MTIKRIYRIQFINQDKVYEVYANHVGTSGIPGFIEIGELVFGEKSSLLVDPGEENLKNEFSGVKCSYVPMHCMVRIDEVERQGQAKISPHEGEQNIHHFPAAVSSSSRTDPPS